MGKTYNHMSTVKLPLKSVRKGSGQPMVDPIIEAIFERNRPKAKPKRHDSVYMTEDRNFHLQGVKADEGYVHQLEPIGDVDKRDNHWLGELELRLKAKTNPLAAKLQKHKELSEDELARRYWAGEASDNPSWEYVAKEATVVSVESTLSPRRPRT